MQAKQAPVETSKINYRAFARAAGDIAYQEAINAGLPEKRAQAYRKVFGRPIEKELRA